MNREPTKEDFVKQWEAPGYRENFDVYSLHGNVTEQQVCDTCLKPFYNKEHVCMEVGCGGGYWPDEHLCDNFKQVYGLDVVPSGGSDRANFMFIEVPDRDYSCFGIDDDSVDFAWSFGVFCHMPLNCVEEYLRSIFSKLKSGGIASLYFSNTRRRPKTQTEGAVPWVANNTLIATHMMKKAGFVDIYDPIPSMLDQMLIGKKP